MRVGLYFATAFVGVAVAGTASSAAEPPDVVTVRIAGVVRDSERLVAQVSPARGSGPPFLLQWERCDASGRSCAAIRGATLPSYTAGPEDVGSRLRVAVRVPTPRGSAEVASQPTAVIAANAPARASLPRLIGLGRVGTDLAAVAEL